MEDTITRSLSVGGVTLSIKDGPHGGPYEIITPRCKIAPEDLQKPGNDDWFNLSKLYLWLKGLLKEYKDCVTLIEPKPTLSVSGQRFIVGKETFTLEESASLAKLLKMEVDYLDAFVNKKTQHLTFDQKLSHVLFRDY